MMGILELLLKVTTILLVALATVALLPKALAGLRHRIYTATLVLSLLLPLLLFAPHLRVVPIALPAVTAITSPRPVVAPSPAPIFPAKTIAPVEKSPEIVYTTPHVTPARSTALNERLFIPIYSIVALFLCLRLLVAHAWIARFCRFGATFPTPLSTHTVQLNPFVSVPMAVGIWRAQILLPTDANTWEQDRLRIVLLHESAHIVRRDCLVQLVGDLACALWWFHPLVWLISCRLRAEAELACDQYVLCQGASRKAYATQLLETALLLRQRRPASVAAPMARTSRLEERVRAILDAAPNPRPSRIALTTLAGVAVAIVPVMLSYRAERPALEATASLSAAEIMERVEIAYRTCETYSDRVVITYTSRTPENRFPFQSSTTEIRFDRRQNYLYAQNILTEHQQPSPVVNTLHIVSGTFNTIFDGKIHTWESKEEMLTSFPQMWSFDRLWEPSSETKYVPMWSIFPLYDAVRLPSRDGLIIIEGYQANASSRKFLAEHYPKYKDHYPKTQLWIHPKTFCVIRMETGSFSESSLIYKFSPRINQPISIDNLPNLPKVPAISREDRQILAQKLKQSQELFTKATILFREGKEQQSESLEQVANFTQRYYEIRRRRLELAQQPRSLGQQQSLERLDAALSECQKEILRWQKKYEASQ